MMGTGREWLASEPSLLALSMLSRSCFFTVRCKDSAYWNAYCVCCALASCRLLRHSLVGLRKCIPVAPYAVKHCECTSTKYLFTYDQ